MGEETGCGLITRIGLLVGDRAKESNILKSDPVNKGLLGEPGRRGLRLRGEPFV